MSDEPDRESQTEEPTEKRLTEAREKGNVPFSSEVGLAASFVAMATATIVFGQSIPTKLSANLGLLFQDMPTRQLEVSTDLNGIVWNIGAFLFFPILPIVLIMMGAGVAASVSQNPPSISLERIAPDFSRLSLSKGFARIYGARARVDFSKAALKLLGGVALVWDWFNREKMGLSYAVAYEPETLPQVILSAGTHLMIEIACLCVVIAAADWYFARTRWMRELRMTKEEVKREFKEAERDPALKARMRSLALSRVRSRMMQSVPKATVVITNPTHLAIALRFVRSEHDAPIVVAKGADIIALRIRELAAEHDIPIIEDRPLARAMYDVVKVDQKIPAQFYKAVAVIIHHLTRRVTVGSGPRA